MGDKWNREPTWWQTYDYLSGRTYILGKRFTGKTAALAYARNCGMAVIPQSTIPVSDLERENAILRNRIKEMEKEAQRNDYRSEEE